LGFWPSVFQQSSLTFSIRHAKFLAGVGSDGETGSGQARSAMLATGNWLRKGQAGPKLIESDKDRLAENPLVIFQAVRRRIRRHFSRRLFILKDYPIITY